MPKTWTQSDDDYLINHSKKSIERLASELDRSTDAVKRRLRALEKVEPKEAGNVDVKEYITSRANRKQPVAPKRVDSKSVQARTAKLSKWSGKGNPYAATKTGYRKDLGIVVRSGWEANVLRVLKAHKIKYEFEPKIFYYPIRRGTKAYTPDIYLSRTREWIEVKGYLDNKSKTKIKRFKIYYPQEFAQFTMIIGKSSKDARRFCAEIGVPNVLFYEEFSKYYKESLPNWEGR